MWPLSVQTYLPGIGRSRISPPESSAQLSLWGCCNNILLHTCNGGSSGRPASTIVDSADLTPSDDDFEFHDSADDMDMAEWVDLPDSADEIESVDYADVCSASLDHVALIGFTIEAAPNGACTVTVPVYAQQHLLSRRQMSSFPAVNRMHSRSLRL